MINFNKPYCAERALEFVADVAKSGQHSGGGKYTNYCEDFLEQRYGVEKVILTSSCTDALEMCALLIDVQPGDEIIVPSYTFVSSANAFVIFGAKIIFVDVEMETLNIDIDALTKSITEKTKAIVAVNYGGQSANLHLLRDICDRFDITLLEDAAQSIDAKFDNKAMGTFGDLATLSFHETKNISSGEGGALLINNKRYVEHGIRIRDKGTNRDAFFKKKVDKYTWVSKGSSYLMSDFTAALLYAQLLEIDRIITYRRNIWLNYFDFFTKIRLPNIRLLEAKSNITQNGHLFGIMTDSIVTRDRLIMDLYKLGIMTVSHYQPLHLSAGGLKYGFFENELPNAVRASETFVRFPLWSHNTPIDDILDTLERKAQELFKC